MDGRELLEPPELAPIRPGEELDTAKVEAYLKEHLPGLEGPMELLQFPGGHANLTYLVRFRSRELVLRRPPLGPVAPGSHDMAREYRVLSKLADHFPAAPHAYLLCRDPGVTGATFLVMERRRGVVVRFSVPPILDRHPEARRRMSFALIDAMVDFHEVDYEKIGLANLGRPEGFVRRQVEGWYGRWQRARHEQLPLFDEVHAWLVARMPESRGAGLVHNDLKLDNLMLDPEDPGRVAAILDWDMTTLGDPLIDLGTLLCYWAQADDREQRAAIASVTAQPGFPTRAEITRRYAQRRGIEVGALAWYEVFGLWKTAVVLQQIFIRFLRGQTRDPRFGFLRDRVPQLVGAAAEVAGRTGRPAAAG